MIGFTDTFLYKKLHGLSPQANYTDRLSDRRLSAKFVPLNYNQLQSLTIITA
jgi:hypothetical protein